LVYNLLRTSKKIKIRNIEIYKRRLTLSLVLAEK